MRFPKGNHGLAITVIGTLVKYIPDIYRGMINIVVVGEPYGISNKNFAHTN